MRLSAGASPIRCVAQTSRISPRWQLEQTGMEVALGLEVVVDDRRRDAGPPCDLADRRRLVAALGEDLGCRPFDDASPFGFR